MSAVDTSCYKLPALKEIQTTSDGGAGEMSCVEVCSDTDTSSLIVRDILNTVLNNVFEISIGQSLQKESKIVKITTNIVGDILENILSPDSPSANDETGLLDDEIKRIIQDMQFPAMLSTKGVGDQLVANDDKVLTEPIKRDTLERKPRLTHLVRSSKQMLSKLMTNDDVVKLSKSEEVQEKVVKVTDFETISESGDLETVMQTVDLEPNLHEKEEADNDNARERAKTLEPVTDKVIEKKSVIKKKLGFGAKIIRYLKKHQSKKE